MTKLNLIYAAGSVGLALLVAVIVYAVVHNPNVAPFALTGKAAGYAIGTLCAVLVAIFAASGRKA